MAPVSLLEELSKRAARFSINLNGQVVLQQTTRPLSGASASVYQGLLRSNGIRVAVKIFHSRPLEDMVTLKRILHEVHLWSKLRHENIVPMLGISTDFNSTISIISEWMGLGNAYVYVQNQSNDPRPLLIDIASGLHYLHTHPSGAIFHGDLKGLNVLVSHDRRALLTDFGFSKLDNSSFSMTVELPWGGSLPWMSPERLENADISAESDVWAFGMTTLELLTRLTPFHDCRNNQSLINRILLGQLPDRPSQELTCFRMTDEWWEMCLSCWKRDPKSRLPVSEVMVNRNLQTGHRTSPISSTSIHARYSQQPFTGLLDSTPSCIVTVDTIDLQPLKDFSANFPCITKMNAYTKLALGTLTSASELIISKKNLEDVVSPLLMKICEVYKFLLNGDTIAKLSIKMGNLTKISGQILECARFIYEYEEVRNYWNRMKKDIQSTSSANVIQYNKTLDRLMQGFANDDIQNINVHHVLEDIRCAGEEKHFANIAYAKGVGVDTSKKCLEGTREEILFEIIDWINGWDPCTPRVFWISGLAGQGKSAIAHTVASWFSELGGICACFRFSRDRNSEQLHEKLFITIARDLADGRPGLRRALVEALSKNRSLKSTADVAQQWRRLILEPALKLLSGIAERILIIIDALDECSGESSREQILRVLTSEQVSNIPTNFRILITSRPLSDINDAIHGRSHIQLKSMDEIPSSHSDRDIRSYICYQLRDIGDPDALNDDEVDKFVRMADGLFEWARLACEFVKIRKGDQGPKERYSNLVLRATGGKDLLDTMYAIILKDVIEPTPRALARFRSVMRQVLWASEPLPFDSLNAFRRTFRVESDRYDVGIILAVMAPLLSGIINKAAPVRALHSSFYEFLTDALRSEEFFVEKSDVHSNMAFASLQVMKKGLRFNICDLETSYLANSEVLDMDQRIMRNIPHYLSYSCRFWGSHLQETVLCKWLVEEVHAFFDSEKVLFWLEALSLLNAMKHAVANLSASEKWVLGHTDFGYISAIARNILKFVQMFGRAILQSTPHLYLSALPFTPLKSILYRQFSPLFLCIPRLVCGRDTDWPAAHLSLEGHTEIITSIALSPDGKRIVSGSYDTTARVWDVETGQQIDPILRGHTDWIHAIAFSPDGKHIASGSKDKTICLWDVDTGMQVGSPFNGHAGSVLSVAFSPNSMQIVSSSEDRTIGLWDVLLGCKTASYCVDFRVPSVTFSPDGKRFLFASGKRDVSWTICMWRSKTAVPVVSSSEEHKSVDAVAFSPDGKLVASTSRYCTVRIWDAETGLPVGEPLEHPTSVYSVAFSPVDKHIVLSSAGKALYLWNIQTGSQLCNPLEGHMGEVVSVAFSPDGKLILSGSYDKTICIWSREISSHTLHQRPHQELTIIPSPVTFTPDKKRIVFGATDEGLCLWDVERDTPIRKSVPCANKSEVSSAALSLDGKYLVLGTRKGDIWLWNMETGSQVAAPVQAPRGQIQSLVFTNDDKQFLSVSGEGCDEVVMAWETENARQLGTTLLIQTGCAVLSRDGTSVAVNTSYSPEASEHADTITVYGWDSKDWHPLTSALDVPRGAAVPLVFSYANELLAWGIMNEGILLWNTRTHSQEGKLIQGHPSLAMPGPVAISPNHKFVAVSHSLDGTIRIWNTETCSLVGSTLVHTRRVKYVEFTPEGESLLSVSTDNIVRIWDVKSITLNEGLSDSTSGMTACIACGGPTQSSSRSHMIRFSSTPSHSLPDSHQLVCSTSAVTGDWRDAVTLREDGWIVGPNDRLLLWVPKPHREWLYYPRNTLVFPRGHFELDLSNMAHGKSWQLCQGGQG